MRQFDLVEYQQRARTTASSKRLFEIWNEVCCLYEQNEITKYEKEEMRDLIFPLLHALGFVRDQVNSKSEEAADTTSTDATNTNNDDLGFISANHDDETGASGN
jgi:hypothetical protein